MAMVLCRRGRALIIKSIPYFPSRSLITSSSSSFPSHLPPSVRPVASLNKFQNWFPSSRILGGTILGGIALGGGVTLKCMSTQQADTTTTTTQATTKTQIDAATTTTTRQAATKTTARADTTTLAERRLKLLSRERPPPPPGCDFEHWLVIMEKPKGELSRDEIIDSYIKTLSKVLGSEEEARMKIYSVSTIHYFAFGALVSKELSNKIKELPGVRCIYADSYLDVENKAYEGEPFINGKAVPYDPKYHDWIPNVNGKRPCNCHPSRPCRNGRWVRTQC